MIQRIGLVALGLAYMMPGHFLPWASFQTQWVSAASMTLLAAAALRGRVSNTPAERFPLMAPALLAWALSSVPLLQHAVGMVPFLSEALLPALFLVAFGMSVAVGALLVRPQGERVTATLLHTLLGAATVSVGLAYAQWLQIGTGVFIADLQPGSRPGANLAQPNHLATLLLLGLIGLLEVYQSRRLSRPVCALLLAWLGFGLVMTMSRTGWLSLAAVAMTLLLWRQRLQLRPGPWAVLAALAVFAATTAAWPSVNEWLLLDVAKLQERLTPGTRWLHWQTLWDAAWRAPWFGYGWQQVTLAQQAAVLDHAPSLEMLQNSHNVVLDLVLWNGLPIGLAVTGLGAWWLWFQGRAIDRPMRLWLWLAVVVICTHAMLEYPLDHAYFLLPLGLFVGMLDASRPGQHEAASVTMPRSVFALALALMTGMLFWIGAEYLKVEQANRDVRLLLMGVGLDRVPRVPPPDVVLLDGPREYHRFMITPARAGMDAAELDWMRRVSQRNAFPPAMLRFALAAGLNGQPAEAALTLRRLCAMHPAERCAEARAAWREAQAGFPGLAGIPGP